LKNNNNDKHALVKCSVIFILCVVGLLCVSLSAKYGYTAGEGFGELFYNLMH
jgi:hypothetical protein